MTDLTQLRADRAQIANNLADIESGRIEPEPFNNDGTHAPDDKEERIASLKRQLSQKDRQIAEREADDAHRP